MTSTKEKKLAIYEWFANLNDDNIIDQIFDIMTHQQDLPELTQEHRERIEKGLVQLKREEKVSNEEVRKKVAQLFSRHK